MTVLFVDGALSPLERPNADRAGAWVLFEGTVRSPNKGLVVEALLYEAYPPMVEAEGLRICEEAEKKWDIVELHLRHGSGRLRPGEIAFQVGVLAGHREEAFAAARWIVEQAKKRLPVWKEEKKGGKER
ncbi:molybdenum cofactor biosynthesis protein MoaE [bacterium]|nr:molybdenum cofactor biosynthesis protein MoaE [bacterium]